MLRPCCLLLWMAALAGAVHAGEGEGEAPGCDLTDIDLLSPAPETTWYLSDASVGLEAGLFAVVDCAEDVYSVSFFVQPENGPRQAIGDPDFETPYEARLESFFAPPIGQNLEWVAEARRVSQPNEILRTTSTVSLRSTDTGDTDEDGLPDDAFALLNRSDDRWISSVSLSGEDERVLTWMRVLRGNDDADLPDTITAELASPGSTAQELTLAFDRALVEGSQLAILVVRFAPTLEALVGSEEAPEFAREPAGELDGEAQYVAVSVLVSGDGGSSFDDISATRLSNRPVRYSLKGLSLDSAEVYTLARHPADFAEVEEKLKLLASTGAWQSIRTQNVDVAAGTITGSLDATGVFAPYRIVDESETCPFGFCASNSLIVQILAALSLLVLQLVPGGVGGGESPCFIATAAYGTPLAPEIDMLRALRDEWLLNHYTGTVFTEAYYRISPAIADVVASSPFIAAFLRMVLAVLILALSQPVLLLAPAAVVLCGLNRARRLTP